MATPSYIWRTTVLFCLCVMLSGTLSIALAQEGESDAETETSTVAESTSIEYTYEDIPNADIIGDFVVGPGKIELEIPAGDSRTIELLVTNRTGEPREYNFEVEDITGSRDGSSSVTLLGDDYGPYTLRDYLTIPDVSVPIDHAERVRIPVTIRSPADAEPGGRYGSVLVTTASRSAEGAGAGVAASSALVARIGTLFFITVPGDVERAGELQDFTTIPPGKMFFGEGPVRLSLLYDNTGSVHLNPYGEIRITNMLGEEVGFLELEPWFALPESLRFREVSWDRDLLMGRYTATAHINRGYDDIVDTMEVTFWVLPWKLALAAFGGLFIFFYLVRLFFKRFEFKRKGS